jgi:hypothetical protein
MAEDVEVLEEDVATRAPGEERRAWARRLARLRVTCRALTGGDGPWEARLRDASPLGVGLLLPGPVTPGVILQLDFAAATRGALRDVLGWVVHVTARSDDWAVGCAFVRDLDPATLRPFRAERARSPAGDARRWRRFPCNVEAACAALDATPGEQSPAHVLDASAGGLRLLLPCEFGPGTLLRLALPGVAGPAWPLLLRVVRTVGHANGDWTVGCEFADWLGTRELQVLLGPRLPS